MRIKFLSGNVAPDKNGSIGRLIFGARDGPSM